MWMKKRVVLVGTQRCHQWDNPRSRRQWVMTLRMKEKWHLWPRKQNKMGSWQWIWWWNFCGSQGLLGPCWRNNIVGGENGGESRDYLRGCCALDCWVWSNEVRCPTGIFGKKATRVRVWLTTSKNRGILPRFYPRVMVGRPQQGKTACRVLRG